MQAPRRFLFCRLLNASSLSVKHSKNKLVKVTSEEVLKFLASSVYPWNSAVDASFHTSDCSVTCGVRYKKYRYCNNLSISFIVLIFDTTLADFNIYLKGNILQ